MKFHDSNARERDADFVRICQLRRELRAIQAQAPTIPNSPEGRAEATRMCLLVKLKALELARLQPTEEQKWLGLAAECDDEVSRMAKLEPFWCEVEDLMANGRSLTLEEGVRRSQELLERYGDLAPGEVLSPVREWLATLPRSAGGPF